MKTSIILVNGYSFSLEDVVIVKEIQDAYIPLNKRKELHRFFTIYLNGGFELSFNQIFSEELDDTIIPVINLLYNAIYYRKTRLDTPNGVIDVSNLDTSCINVNFKTL